MSSNVPGHVWPSLKFWYCLAFILSPSWGISFLAMDFVKKTTPLLFVVLIMTIFLLSLASNCVLWKFYIRPQTERFFRSYTGAKKTAGYAVMLVGGVGLNYIPEKSVASMLTFISLSLYCLCTLVCIQPHTDFGAFEFLLGGSVTQAFKCFGAHSPYSWLVLFACIAILSIRYCLKPRHSSGEASSHEHQDQLHQLEAGRLTPQISGGVLDGNSWYSQSEASWMLQHPSALEMFGQITSASKGKQIVMFLDYDGTLSPIVDDPDRAFMSDAMRAAVKQLATYFPTAIVSGRCRDQVYSFVQLAELYYAGSDGMDIKGPSEGAQYKNDAEGILCQPASEFVPMIDEAYHAMLEKTNSIPGAKVEHNKFCISVHYRLVDEMRWSELAQQVRSVLKEYPKLRLIQGRKVLEIRPTIKWDKGNALEFLLESLGYANCTNVFPIYIGDDRTDEDAFKAIRERGQGFGILVSKIPKETNASYYLQEPFEVKNFLRRLVRWKRASLRRQLRVQKQLEELKISPIE